MHSSGNKSPDWYPLQVLSSKQKKQYLFDKHSSHVALNFKHSSDGLVVFVEIMDVRVDESLDEEDPDDCIELCD